MAAPAAFPDGPTLAPSTSAGRPIAPAAVTVNYTSSVDAFPLSYSEILPAGYSSSVRYPLAVEMHGISLTESTPMPGGYPTGVDLGTATAASDAGYILIVPNTRTGDGFYIDSPYTGPQAQDIQDAIQSEKSLRLVGSVYLFGFSMGGMGSLSIGLQHPSEFAGLAAIATFSDIYQLYDYQVARGSIGLNGALLAVAGDQLPNASAFSHQVFDELAELRAHSELTRGLRMYLASGGNDPTAPNNPAFWPYLQANNSALQTTCLVSASLTEPPNCTLPLAALHAADPTNFSYRFVYEPNGPHDYQLLNATDMFRFFSGQAPDGPYVGQYPTPAPVPPPVPLVTLVTQPFDCGTIAWAGTPFPNGFTLTVGAGSYSVSFSPCPGYALTGVIGRNGVSYDAATAAAVVTKSGALVAVFAPLIGPPTATIIVSATGGCPTVSVNGTVVPSGSGVSLALGSYVAAATPCVGSSFVSWSASGGVQVWSPTNAMTGFTLSASGGLVAIYVPNSGTVQVNVYVSPRSCGPIYLNGTAVANASVVGLLPGTYPVLAPACAGYGFTSWNVVGGLFGGGSAPSATINVSSSGSVTAKYTVLTGSTFSVAVAVDPATCGSVVVIDGVRYANATSALLDAGRHAIASGDCSSHSFSAWRTSGGVSVSGGALEVTGNGTLSLAFESVPGNGTVNATTSSTIPAWMVPYLWVGGGLAAGAAFGIGAAIRWRRPATPAEEDPEGTQA